MKAVHVLRIRVLSQSRHLVPDVELADELADVDRR